MDAHAHLLSLGWAGPGHSLDSRPHKGRRGLAYDPKQAQNNGNGLIKPLLISQKKNTFGVGKKAHEPAAGNEWWLKGFETALSNVGKSDSERTSGTATPELGRPTSGANGKHSGLYGFFVKGGEMVGTIGVETETENISPRRKKRKSDVLGSQEESSGSSADEERPIDTRENRKLKGGTEEFDHIGTFLEARDKNQKRRHRQQKADAVEEFQQVGEFFEARSSKRKASSNSLRHHAISTPTHNPMAEVVEDSDQERRREEKERRAKKAAKSAEALQTTSDRGNALAPPIAILQDDQDVKKNDNEASLAKAARRAEKQRRKGPERV